MKKKAIVAGHLCIDITPVFPGKKVKRIEELLRPGKLIHTNGVDIHTGGAVSNTGLAMKILGSDVELMGKVGKDAFGEMVLNTMKHYGAEKGTIVDENSATSYTIALAVPGIDRTFLHDPGANDTFCCDDMDFEKIREAALFHFGYPPLMKRMYENEGEETLKLLKKVKETGPAVSLDLAAVDADSNAGKTDWKRVLEKCLPYVDFFVPSVEELCFMLDAKRYEAWTQRVQGGDLTEGLTLDDIRPLGEKALALGAKVVLIKCGAPGIYYRTADAEAMKPLCEKLGLSLQAWADKEGFEASYKPEAVLSGTGAGDTSIAAFLSSVLQEETLEEALRMAVATGACCVAAYDSLSGLKPLAELKEKIRGGWEKNPALV